MKKTNLFIVIAAYNEGKSISKVIAGLERAGYHNIVVVDDGSADNTFEEASKTGVMALRHSINRGQGASLKTGIEFALRQGADIIVTFDADGQHRAEDIPKMVRPVAEGTVDVTFGSRFISKDDSRNVPWFRRITLKIAVLVVWIFYGVKMTDAHNGFRAMNRKAATAIRITSDRMEHSSQIVEEVYRKKLKYSEVPVVIKYSDYTLKKGHGGFVQGIKVLWQMIVRRLLD